MSWYYKENAPHIYGWVWIIRVIDKYDIDANIIWSQIADSEDPVHEWNVDPSYIKDMQHLHDDFHRGLICIVFSDKMDERYAKVFKENMNDILNMKNSRNKK